MQVKPFEFELKTDLSNLSLIEAEQLIRSMKEDGTNILRFLSGKRVWFGFNCVVNE